MDSDMEVVKPWSKPGPGEDKPVFVSPEAFRVISKYAAKRGLMETKTPGEVVEMLLREFRVEETS